MTANDGHTSRNKPKGQDASDLEEKLRRFFEEQRRLRALLNQTRADLDRVNAGLLNFQHEYCIDAAREEEYLQCLEKVTGIDPRAEELRMNEGLRDGVTFEQIIQALETQTDLVAPKA